MNPAPEAAAPSVVVATACPSCGAPLELGETAHATRCTHCRVRLAVTGREHTLSYRIAPRIPAADARSLVRFAQPTDGTHRRVDDPRLFLFPYYRLTGVELRWTRPPAPKRGSEAPAERIAHGEAELLAIAAAIATRPRPTNAPDFAGRWIERNVVACDSEGLANYSLGVRPSVLRLEPYRPDDDATVVSPSHAIEQRLISDREVLVDTSHTLHRTMLARHMSVVYFPYWVVGIRAGDRSRCTIVDGTAGSIVAEEVDPTVLERLSVAPSIAPRTLGFRPLVCPNCGWDLPDDPDQVAFHCQTCGRAWELTGDRLDPLPFTVAATPRDGADYEMLPVWMVRYERPEGTGSAFAPAFLFRNLKRLVDLGQSLTRVATAPPDGIECERPLGRCNLDRNDGTAFARFVLAGLQPDGTPLEDWRPHAPALVWLPFRVGPYALHETATGTALPKLQF